MKDFFDEDTSHTLKVILQDLNENKPKTSKAYIPVNISSNVLKYIRAQACANQDKKIECSKWSQKLPKANSLEPVHIVNLKAPFIIASGYVCKGCTHPRITASDVMEKLIENKDSADKAWRRYVNQKQPMKTNDLKSSITNAYLNKWLTYNQFLNLISKIDTLDATRKALFVLIKKVKDRKAYIQAGIMEFEHEELIHEIDKQKKLIEYEKTKIIANYLNKYDVSKKNIAFLKSIQFK